MYNSYKPAVQAVILDAHISSPAPQVALFP